MRDYNSLIEENEYLKMRIADLERALFPEPDVPFGIRLTSRQRNIFSLLVRRSIVSHETLATAIAGQSGRENVERVTVHSHIHHLREKLKSHGITIEHERHDGYRIPHAIRLSLRPERQSS